MKKYIRIEKKKKYKFTCTAKFGGFLNEVALWKHYQIIAQRIDHRGKPTENFGQLVVLLEYFWFVMETL